MNLDICAYTPRTVVSGSVLVRLVTWLTRNRGRSRMYTCCKIVLACRSMLKPIYREVLPASDPKGVLCSVQFENLL